RVRDIATIGGLMILGGLAEPAEIVVRDRPLKLSAETVRIENVRWRRVPSGRGSRRASAALVTAQCQSVELERCVLAISDGMFDPAVDTAASPLIGLAWKLVDSRDRRGGSASFRNTVFLGGDAAVHVAETVRRIEFQNCLRLAGG